MIFINGNWEDVRTVEDAVTFVRENMGSEFANKLEELFEKNTREATGNLRNKIETALAIIDDAATLLEAEL